MYKTIVALFTTLVLSLPGLTASNEKDGQGCMYSQTKGSCAMQLISQFGKNMECELFTEGTTRSGRKVKSTKTVTMKPLEVQSLDVFTTESDPFVKIDGWAKCR